MPFALGLELRLGLFGPRQCSKAGSLRRRISLFPSRRHMPRSWRRAGTRLRVEAADSGRRPRCPAGRPPEGLLLLGVPVPQHACIFRPSVFPGVIGGRKTRVCAEDIFTLNIIQLLS